MSEELNLTFKPSNGQANFQLPFALSTKVKIVKIKVGEKFGCTASEVKLLCKGKVLKDHMPLSEYKITEKDIINANLPQTEEQLKQKQKEEEEKAQAAASGLGGLPEGL